MGLIEHMEADRRVNRGNHGSIAAFDREHDTAVEFWDDLTGKRLDPKLVKLARAEEMAAYRKHGVYIKVDEHLC